MEGKSHPPAPNFAGYLAGLYVVLDKWTTTSLPPPPDDEDPEPWQPDDYPFQVIERLELRWTPPMTGYHGANCGCPAVRPFAPPLNI